LDTELFHDEALSLDLRGRLCDNEGESVDPHLLELLLILDLNQEAELFDQLAVSADLSQ